MFTTLVLNIILFKNNHIMRIYYFKQCFIDHYSLFFWSNMNAQNHNITVKQDLNLNNY
jgi:hypothetical protein